MTRLHKSYLLWHIFGPQFRKRRQKQWPNKTTTANETTITTDPNHSKGWQQNQNDSTKQMTTVNNKPQQQQTWRKDLVVEGLLTPFQQGSVFQKRKASLCKISAFQMHVVQLVQILKRQKTFHQFQITNGWTGADKVLSLIKSRFSQRLGDWFFFFTVCHEIGWMNLKTYKGQHVIWVCFWYLVSG